MPANTFFTIIARIDISLVNPFLEKGLIPYIDT